MLTNNKTLLPSLPLKLEQKSLLTDFHRVDEIPYRNNLDARLVIIEEPGNEVSLRTDPEIITVTGGVADLIRQTQDLRYSLFGNEGLIFRQTLKLLETRYGIFSFHACIMYQASAGRLFIICGSAGSGKTCFILKGLELGLKVFSTEMAHFKITSGRIEFYKGSLIDNVRVGNLKYNFPSVGKKIKIAVPRTENEWGKKIPLDLSRFQTRKNSLLDPGIVIVLPRIEQERRDHFLRQENDRRRIIRNLFENASEKIGQSFLLYESIPVVCLDTAQAAAERLGVIKALLAHKKTEKIATVIGGPENCWQELIN